MSMTLLIIGVLAWISVHWFKRVAPNLRAAMATKIGAGPASGVIAILILISVILMVVGYRGADVLAVYSPPSWGGHLNNLMMIFAVIMMGMGSSKGRARSWMRHPMLSGAIVWAAAHLLVNGDQASLILFGGIIIWALGSMMLINRAQGAWDRPEPGPIKGDIKLLVISAVVFVVISGVHIWLGYNPFTGGYA